MEEFPAVLIGGPPHSGKSVLTYSLTQELRRRGIEHYVVRAAPDGEGDWANEAAQELVREIRIKGEFSPEFTEFVCRSILGRHLPLLVDAGGQPTPAQERILDCCTHAVLLTRDAASRKYWQGLAEDHGLPILADLHSALHGDADGIGVASEGPALRATIAGLARGSNATGPAFDALAERLAAILYRDAEDLYRVHERLCPVDLVIHLGRLARTFGIALDGQWAHWEPRHLAGVLDYLPESAPLALYGRGPNWLYTAVCLLAAPAPFHHFDPRLGWLQPQALGLRAGEGDELLRTQVRSGTGWIEVEGVLPTSYLDYDHLATLAVPPLPQDKGIVLSGKLPHWLYASLALTYRAAPWMAVYQPHLNGSVVVHSAVDGPAIGEIAGRAAA